VQLQQVPPFGSGAWTFSGSNAVLILKMNAIPGMNQNNLFNGTVALAKLTTTQGSLTVQNGVIVGYVAPT
jgi:hypothetical protein